MGSTIALSLAESDASTASGRRWRPGFDRSARAGSGCAGCAAANGFFGPCGRALPTVPARQCASPLGPTLSFMAIQKSGRSVTTRTARTDWAGTTFPRRLPSRTNDGSPQKSSVAAAAAAACRCHLGLPPVAGLSPGWSTRGSCGGGPGPPDGSNGGPCPPDACQPPLPARAQRAGRGTARRPWKDLARNSQAAEAGPGGGRPGRAGRGLS